MTPTQEQYIAAIKALDEAAYAALAVARDTTELPMVNRQILRRAARISAALVNAGLETAPDVGSTE